jgi:hypothetical protein
MISLNAQTFAMNIVEPYEARNVSSPAVNVGKSLLVAGGTCALGAYAQCMLEKPVSLFSLAGLAVVGGVVGYIYYDWCNHPELIDVLLTNPVEGLTNIYATNKKFCNELQQERLEDEKDVLRFAEKLEFFVRKYEQENPLFLLGECTQNGFFACIFTRSINPSYRERFEERVSQKLIEKISLNKQNESPINYTSFGCGGALSETIILAKALAKKPNAHLTIHLIEGNNISYVAAVDFLGFSREMKINQKLFNFNDKLSEYRKFIESKGETLECTDNELHIQLVSNCMVIQKKNEQILTWLTSTFPDAKLSLFIHDFTDNYFKYLDKSKLPYADVVSAADIQDEISLMRDSVTNYKKLCTKTLEKKSNACNVWLAKDDHEKVSINSLSLIDSQGAKKIDLNGLSAYALSEEL